MNLKKSEIIALKNENLSCREIAVGLLTFYQTWKKMERGKVTGMSEQSKQNQAMCVPRFRQLGVSCWMVWRDCLASVIAKLMVLG